MKARLFLLPWVLIFLISSGCNRSNKSGEAQDLEASLRLAWIPSGSYAGEVAGMKKFAAEHGLGLTIEPGGLGLNPITLVQTGESTCGTAAAEEVLAANDKGASLVIVGLLNYNAPVGFVSLAEKNIKEPTDFEGKRVGILPFGSTNLLYQSMLKRNNVDRSKITEITVSPDLKPFLDGNYDVQPVFVYDETVTLERQGVNYNLIEPVDFGVDNFRGQVYFCRQPTLEQNPELVRALVETMADGWNYALEHQQEAIQMLKEFAPEIVVEREEQVLAKGADYFREYKGQPVNSDIESWSAMVEELRELNIISNPVDLDKVLDFSFIQEYYAKSNEGEAGS